jgi:hypothetical protein
MVWFGCGLNPKDSCVGSFVPVWQCERRWRIYRGTSGRVLGHWGHYLGRKYWYLEWVLGEQVVVGTWAWPLNLFLASYLEMWAKKLTCDPAIFHGALDYTVWTSSLQNYELNQPLFLRK